MANLFQSIVGGGSSPGLLGLGQYKPPQYNVDPNAFTSPTSEEDRKRLMESLQQQQGRQSALGGEDPFRQGQMNLAQALQAQASGQAPSVAEAQLKQAQDRAVAQQMGGLAANRQLSAGLAARLGQQGTANLQQQLGSEAAGLRLQEQQGAQQSLAQALASGRAGDIETGSLKDQMERFYQQSLMDKAEQDRQALMQQQQLQSGQALGYAGIGQQAYNQAGQNRQNFLGKMGQAFSIGSL